MKKTQAVLFDLFETLVSEFDVPPDVIVSIADELGVAESDFKPFWKAIAADRNLGVFANYEEAITSACKSAGIKATDDKIFAIAEAKRKQLQAIMNSVRPDVISTIEELRAMGLKIGIISNAVPEDPAAFANSPLAPLVDATVFSCEHGILKPEPELYLQACKLLDVDPEACVFVGDGNFNELQGAFEVGITPYRANWFWDIWPEHTKAWHKDRWNVDYQELLQISDLPSHIRVRDKTAT